MLARIRTCTVVGVDALPVRVEVHISSGLPAFTLVGLAQGAVREGRERVTAALANSGFQLPLRRITVNLAPAGLRKDGTSFDLAIALGVLTSSGQLPSRGPAVAAGSPVDMLDETLVLGELGLDGVVRGVPGVLPATILARELGLARVLVPAANEREASMIEGIEVRAVASLTEAADALRGAPPESQPADARHPPEPAEPPGPDLSDVRGQLVARRALEIVAAGGHHLLLVGPPGVGKTMLARRLPGILPPLTTSEALEVARVRSVAGPDGTAHPVRRRPFRAPHHTVSYAGLVGGGRPPRPGEISLAHQGVLFLDELGEFDRRALEALRQPLEEGSLRIARASGTVRLPARFVLVAAMNPCPCGHLGDGTDRCRCDDRVLARYRARVSGPLLDRLDVRVELAPPGGTPLDRGAGGEPSARVAARVRAARERQTERWRGAGPIRCNAEAGPGALRRFGAVTEDARRLLASWTEVRQASARSVDRVLRVARTIADLEAAERVRAGHVAEALQYRLPGVLERV